MEMAMEVGKAFASMPPKAFFKFYILLKCLQEETKHQYNNKKEKWTQKATEWMHWEKKDIKIFRIPV